MFAVDECRVKLKDIDGNGRSDYINASYIKVSVNVSLLIALPFHFVVNTMSSTVKGYPDLPKHYIATQGECNVIFILLPETFDDHH